MVHFSLFTRTLLSVFSYSSSYFTFLHIDNTFNFSGVTLIHCDNCGTLEYSPVDFFCYFFFDYFPLLTYLNTFNSHVYLRVPFLLFETGKGSRPGTGESTVRVEMNLFRRLNKFPLSLAETGKTHLEKKSESGMQAGKNLRIKLE